jgi:hypothetical protein
MKHLQQGNGVQMNSAMKTIACTAFFYLCSGIGPMVYAHGWHDHDHSHDHEAREIEVSLTQSSPVARSAPIPEMEIAENGLPILSSLPHAPGVIYLDFDGGKGLGGVGHTPYGGDLVFDATEQENIYRCWEEVSAYFAMFDINVTTVEPDKTLIPTAHCIISDSVTSGSANTGKYGDSSEAARAQVSSSSVTDRVTSIVHEVGHVFGLNHQAVFDSEGNRIANYRGSDSYNRGVIMGIDTAGIFAMWHTAGPATGQGEPIIVNEVAFIANQIIEKAAEGYTGDGFRPDDHANDFSGATPIDLITDPIDGMVSQNIDYSTRAVIERFDDADLFQFEWPGGYLTISANARKLFKDPDSTRRTSSLGPNLRIFDSQENLVMADLSSSPADVDTSVQQTNLAPGTYTIQVTGAGDVGDLGEYLLSIQGFTADPSSTVLLSDGDNSWNTGSWTQGVPSGSVNAIVAYDLAASVDGTTPTWDGLLTLQTGSSLEIGSDPGAANALGGATRLVANHATILAQPNGNVSFPEIYLLGGLTVDRTSASIKDDGRIFSNPITGPADLTIVGSDQEQFIFQTENTFTGDLLLNAKDRHEVIFNATGSAGTGNVTVTSPGTSGPELRSAVLIVNANDVFADAARLTLNGRGWNQSRGGRHNRAQYLIIMNADDTVAELVVKGKEQPVGVYTSANTDGWLSGPGTLTVTGILDPGSGSTQYDSWADSFGISSTDNNPDMDTGGMPTKLEWVLGGDPSDGSDDISLMPTFDISSGTYEFRRTDAAHNDPNTTIQVEYSEDLQEWTTAVENDMIHFSEQDDHHGEGIDHVSVIFDPGIEESGRFFIRLKVIIGQDNN